MVLTNDNYVKKAEDVILSLAGETQKNGRPVGVVSTSKIRNLLAMISDIYNDVQNLNGKDIPEDIRERIGYLKVRFVYECGREAKVKKLVEKAEILKCIDECTADKESFLRFARYMEALVAYRKYHVNDKDD